MRLCRVLRGSGCEVCMRLVCMEPCVLGLCEANSKHTKAAHQQRPSARIQEVDWDTCDAGSEEAPVGDTV
jgi:hypothetical protein